MAKDAYINARMERSLLESVDAIFRDLGMSRSEALTVIFTQIKLHNGLPFPVRIPNAETIEAIEDVRLGRNLTTMKLEDFKSYLSQGENQE